MPKNPFTPTFGKNPPVLAGRRDLLDDWDYALTQGSGTPGRVALVTGARGVGKTVMLNQMEATAREHGWRVVSESTSTGLMDRLTHSVLPNLLSEVDPEGAVVRRVTGGSLPGWLGGGGVQTSVSDRRPIEPDARLMVEALCRALSGRGLLITVDEIHRSAEEDLRRLTTIVQHAVREDLDIAFVGAGLPTNVQSLLEPSSPITFLRRADQVHLGNVAPSQAREALAIPARDAGLPFERDALEQAVKVSHGYPFLIQEVGFQCVRVAQSDRGSTITAGHVDLALTKARRRLAESVHEPALTGLSGIDRAFLAAMSRDDGPSRMGDIAARLDVNAQYAGVYRQRLVEAEVITPVGHGLVDFALPYLREHLRDQGVL